MKKFYLFKLLLLVPWLNGCGQMGPLYLPGTAPPIHVEKEKTEQPDAEEKADSEKNTSSENQP